MAPNTARDKISDSNRWTDAKEERKLNILFLSTENPYPPNSGHRLRTYNTLKHTAGKHNVFFLGFAKSREDLKYTEPLREFCASADVFVIPDDISKASLVKSLFLNLFSMLPYTAQKYYTPEMRRRMAEILRDNRIDIVHFDMLHLARYRREFNQIPTVMIEHNVESLRLRRLALNSTNPLFKAFMYLQYLKLYRFEKKECSRFDICAPVSANDRDFLHDMSPSARFVVVPNGVDTEYFAPDGSDITPDSIIWVGGMKDMYNREAVEYFCKAVYPMIYSEVPGIKFTAIGKSPTPRLRELADGNPNINILGYVDDVRPEINRAAVYIAPIVSGGGTKLKILNALAMGKAVVTTTVGAEGIDVVNGEHLLIADEPRLFAEHTVKLLKDPEKAARLGANGRRLMCERYDWDIIGAMMDDIYHKVVNI